MLKLTRQRSLFLIYLDEKINKSFNAERDEDERSGHNENGELVQEEVGIQLRKSIIQTATQNNSIINVWEACGKINFWLKALDT